MPAVMSYDHALFHRLAAKAFDVVGDTLRGSADHVVVHAVGSGLDLAS